MVLKEDGVSEEAYTYLSMMWLLSLRPKYLAVQLSSFLQVRDPKWRLCPATPHPPALSAKKTSAGTVQYEGQRPHTQFPERPIQGKVGS